MMPSPGRRPAIAVLLLALCMTGATAAEPRFSKQYVDGRFGQVHVLRSEPLDVTQAHTALACFAPNPAAGRYYRMFMAELGRDRVMLAPDYPGLGASDPPPAPMDMATFAASMAETLEALGYGNGGQGAVDVCGYHTGALVAIELAVSRPDLVRRLLLLGIPYYDAAGRIEQYEKNVVDKPIPEYFAALEGSWDFAVTNREKGVRLERGYDNFVDVLRARDRRTWAYRAVFTYPAEVRAPLVRQPVLILNTHGSLEAETRALAPFFPDAELIEVPELHHGIFDVGPGILAAHARPFLDGD